MGHFFHQKSNIFGIKRDFSNIFKISIKKPVTLKIIRNLPKNHPFFEIFSKKTRKNLEIKQNLNLIFKKSKISETLKIAKKLYHIAIYQYHFKGLA